ncbi:MAG TPA: hypothetical protein VFA46_16175 [Actinomycetes bacterium]|jgi:DNA-binding response OmpR family regulator|nr:hypothetical protein [Actinomycetes bacterium]
MADGSPRVLLVEDNGPLAAAVAEGLAAEGFDIEVARQDIASP